MSVQRYTSAFIGEMRHDEKGEWVLHSDYEKLVQDSIQDHHNWRSKLNFLEADYKSANAALAAEVDRLRKHIEMIYRIDPLLKEAIGSAILAQREEGSK